MKAEHDETTSKVIKKKNNSKYNITSRSLVFVFPFAVTIKMSRNLNNSYLPFVIKL